MAQTDRSQTEGHGDSMTESAQSADAVKIHTNFNLHIGLMNHKTHAAT